MDTYRLLALRPHPDFPGEFDIHEMIEVEAPNARAASSILRRHYRSLHSSRIRARYDVRLERLSA